MDGDDVVKRLIITGVKSTDHKLGHGIYGKVFTVDYNGVKLAAKEILRFKLESERSTIKQYFLQECLLHSKLHHPNIVKML